MTEDEEREVQMGAGREKKESRETSNQGFKQGRVMSQRTT